MKVSLLVAAALFLVLAVLYALVRLDVLDAEALRLVPAIVAVIVAVGLIYSATRSRQRKKKTNRNTSARRTKT